MLAAMLVHKEVLLLNVHLKPKEIINQLDQLGVTTVLHSKERRNQLSHLLIRRPLIQLLQLSLKL